jgi:tetratricopeptide (TPR) repeat protein
VPSQTGYSSTELPTVDHTTFADVREKLAQQEEEPEPQTLADQYFENGVKAFEQGDYGTAIKNFADAMSLDPNDVILPFAYVQGLFTDGRYTEAADALRSAIDNLPPDQEGLFFPRGLYPDDEILFEQIERLKQKAQIYRNDPDMQLLLGYQLLGIEKYDEAEETLQTANMYGVNFDSANVLLDLLEKLKTK